MLYKKDRIRMTKNIFYPNQKEILHQSNRIGDMWDNTEP